MCIFRLTQRAGTAAASRYTVPMPPIRSQATYDDVNLLLRLYEMRRETRMREARAWFTANFRPQSWAETLEKWPHGSAENASIRQVLSYWEMVASFVTSGVLYDDLFFENTRELLLCYVRIEKLIPEVRKANNDPFAYHNLETVARRFIEWMNHRAPGSYEAFAKRVG